MDELKNWPTLMAETLNSILNSIADLLPTIIGACLILVLGWLIAKFIAFLTKKMLVVARVDALADRFKGHGILEQIGTRYTLSTLGSKFMYWIVILLVIITASETLGWTILSEEVSKLTNWLPSLFSALIFFLLGLYIASLLRKIIKGATRSMGIKGGLLLSNIVFYLIVIIVSLSALKQAGIDTTILNSNLLLILSGVMLAAAISYGLASKDILENVLCSSYSKRILKKGQLISFQDLQGTVDEINSINVVVRTEMDRRVVIPSSELVKNSFVILREASE